MKNISIDQKGRSMIEMLGVLAIVGVLSVAGIAGYSKAMAKYKVNKVTDQVSTLSANIKTLFASVGSYSGLNDTTAKSNQRAYKLGLFPDDMVKTCGKSGATYGQAAAATDCIRNGMNGAVGVYGSGNKFTIAMAGLTKEACTALLTSDWGGAAGFTAISVDSTNGTKAELTEIKAADTTCATSATASYSPACLSEKGVYAAAKASCVSADANTVIWTFN